jgi:hypothetical protein
VNTVRLLLAKWSLLAALLAVAAGGCATRNHFADSALMPDDGRQSEAVQRAQHTLAQLFPARYHATQRAIITAVGKQFTCDGLLAVAPDQGYHLALASSFGTVTDLRVTPAGRTELLKVTPLFRADWSRDYVARDLRCLFVPPARLEPAGRFADGRLVLRAATDRADVDAEYVFSADGSRWQELDLRRNGKTFYRATIGRYVKFPGLAAEVPGEFDVGAESYRMNLRLTSLTAEAQP